MQVLLRANPFDLRNVRLLEGPFKDAMERDRKYLHDLDADRLLHMFRVTSGLPSASEAYGGWEKPDCEIRGHSVGHYLTACALMYASTGDTKLKEKADYIVAELEKCQAAMPSQGYNAGYLEAFPESFFDRVDNLQPVWVPWYTCHKILQGLVDIHKYCGNQQSLDVAVKTAGWVKLRTDKLTEEHMQKTLDLEFGGMGEALANLYVATGDPDHLMLAKRFDHKVFFNPLAQGEDNLKGLHSNTHIPEVVSAAREYELTGEAYYHDITSNFWDHVTGHRSFATGGTSSYEHWRTPRDVMASEINVESQETCCTYNMLKLTKHLFSWHPEAHIADYYERALLNGILSTQHPENGMMMYYVAMRPGHWKVFNTPYDAFWCCTGTGMENHAKYGESIYFYDDNSLYVNLFISSELDWEDKGVKIVQKTNFPEDEKITLTISTENPVQFDLKFRIPYWIAGDAVITVNGEKQNISTEPSSYAIISRTWTDGDKVEVLLPMALHVVPMPDDPNLIAIMYGPLVLAGKLGTEQFTKDLQFTSNQRSHHRGTKIEVPAFIDAPEDVNAWIKPVDGEVLTFKTVGVGRPYDVTLIPFYKLFDERYSIYWRKFTEAGYIEAIEAEKTANERREAEAKDALARTFDVVELGNEESENAHNLQFESSESGKVWEPETEYHGRSWRMATLGGWFSWDLSVLADKPMSVRCDYWGYDDARIFDIVVEGNVIAQETLTGELGDRLFSKEYNIPFELTQGKDKVTVRFQAHPGNIAGGVFGIATLTSRD